MSVLANFSILSSGMGLGFPAITYQSITNKSDPMALSNEQASWFGKYLFFFYHFPIFRIIMITYKS